MLVVALCQAAETAQMTRARAARKKLRGDTLRVLCERGRQRLHCHGRHEEGDAAQQQAINGTAVVFLGAPKEHTLDATRRRVDGPSGLVEYAIEN